MSWDALFSRAEAFDVTVEDVRESLETRRAERREGEGGEEDG